MSNSIEVLCVDYDVNTTDSLNITVSESKSFLFEQEEPQRIIVIENSPNNISVINQINVITEEKNINVIGENNNPIAGPQGPSAVWRTHKKIVDAQLLIDGIIPLPYDNVVGSEFVFINGLSQHDNYSATINTITLSLSLISELLIGEEITIRYNEK